MLPLRGSLGRRGRVAGTPGRTRSRARPSGRRRGVSTRQTYWHDYPLIFPMGLRKTRNLELAQARGEPLADTCPVHAWPVPEAAIWELDEIGGVWTVTFYPCEHRGYPQRPAMSRFLYDPIAQPPRLPRWQRWTNALRGERRN